MTEVCTCRTIAPSGWDRVQQVVDPTCPLHATYTAAEVKVLTEAALRLGRKEAGEEIAARIKTEMHDFPSYAWNAPDVHKGLKLAYVIAQDVASRAVPDATSARTDSKVDPEPPRDPGSASRPLDLDRVIAVKWGDKVIDPNEVVYVLREGK